MDASLRNLLIAVMLLLLGSGLQGVLTPVRGELSGFPTAMIGGLGTLYYVGFVVGCLVLPDLVRRVGHIRCFSALAAVAASAALLQGLFVLPWVWLACRCGIGFCFAGLFIVIESWLNDAVTPETRGRTLGLYMTVTWLGVIGGKMLFSIAPADSFDLFAIASMAVALSLVPIALTNGAMPRIPRPARLGVMEVYRTAPVGLVGCVAVGLANGAFWTFGPLAAKAQVSSSLGVSLYMSACLAGGALSQWPLGKFSDRLDRRWVIVALCLATAVLGYLLTAQEQASDGVLLILAALFGASALSVYPICIAHANDRADPSTHVETSSFLLMAFGIGAAVGPFMVGLIVARAGIASLFVAIAAIHLTLASFVLVRIAISRPVPGFERALFASQPPISHGTQPLVELQRAGPEFDAAPSADDDPCWNEPRGFRGPAAREDVSHPFGRKGALWAKRFARALQGGD